MGCNSHLAIEYRPFDKSWWTYALNVAESRDYRLYAAMADVRNGAGIEPVAQPRGFPLSGYEDHLTDAGEYLKEHCADHSFTWLTPNEFFEAMSRAREGEYAKEWLVLKGILELLVKFYGHDNVRLLVGFDN